MTREEAIKILSCRDNRGLPITWQDGFVDAVDTAIEALQENESLAKSVNDAAELIRKLQKKNEWIPSERLLDYVSTAYENGYQQGKFEAQQWILCSERLPEQDVEYLVTAISDMGTLPVIMITSFFKDSNYGKNHWHTGWSKSKVTAWMPLPEPYKENET